MEGAEERAGEKAGWVERTGQRAVKVGKGLQVELVAGKAVAELWTRHWQAVLALALALALAQRVHDGEYGVSVAAVVDGSAWAHGCGVSGVGHGYCAHVRKAARLEAPLLATAALARRTGLAQVGASVDGNDKRYTRGCAFETCKCKRGRRRFWGCV